MGLINPPSKCFITGAPTTNVPSGYHSIEYNTVYAGRRFFFSFLPDHQNSQFVEDNKYVLQGLIVNNKFHYDKSKVGYDNNRLEKIIQEAIIPKTPKEKLDSFINLLFSLQKFEGSEIKFDSFENPEILLRKLYFKNHQEYWFYLSTLKDYGFITFLDASSCDGNDAVDIRLTYKGLEYVINLHESGEQSKKCFIAMQFSDNMTETRNTIKDVVVDCGYQPLVIDEVHYDSEKTINDAIISSIKESKFLIADFTGQRHGVYFEAGYALGRGRPVIYLCQLDDFKNSHFDTNHYPHIVYKDLGELKVKLENKIKAWID